MIRFSVVDTNVPFIYLFTKFYVTEMDPPSLMVNVLIRDLGGFSEES